MKDSTIKILDELIVRYPQLKGCKEDILKAFLLLKEAFDNKKKLLVCGNGGSAADSEHIVGELMKRFRKERPLDKQIVNELSKYGDEGMILEKSLDEPIRAISLTTHIALSTAFSNDNDPRTAFAQKLYGLGDSGDVLLSISTSGNSKNCVLAAILAKAMNIKTIALTGAKESKLSEICDVTIKAPETEVYKVQELHLPIYHALCAMLEDAFF